MRVFHLSVAPSFLVSSATRWSPPSHSPASTSAPCRSRHTLLNQKWKNIQNLKKTKNKKLLLIMYRYVFYRWLADLSMHFSNISWRGHCPNFALPDKPHQVRRNQYKDDATMRPYYNAHLMPSSGANFECLASFSPRQTRMGLPSRHLSPASPPVFLFSGAWTRRQYYEEIS